MNDIKKNKYAIDIVVITKCKNDSFVGIKTLCIPKKILLKKEATYEVILELATMVVEAITNCIEIYGGVDRKLLVEMQQADDDKEFYSRIFLKDQSEEPKYRSDNVLVPWNIIDSKDEKHTELIKFFNNIKLEKTGD